MYYLYQHIRLDKNEIFYIGISRHNKNRKYKRAYQRDKRNIVWKRIVAKTNFKYEIVLESPDINVIKDKEIELIAKFGKIVDGTGTLANITDGGEGTFGYKPSKETKLKQSLARKGSKHTEQTKSKMRLAQTGKFVLKEVGEKISSSKKGKEVSKHDNNPLKVLHIPTGTIFKSVASTAEYFSLRRCTLSKKMHSGEEKDFEFLNKTIKI